MDYKISRIPNQATHVNLINSKNIHNLLLRSKGLTLFFVSTGVPSGIAGADAASSK